MKAFYASVSSVIRGLNPLKTRLAVVGDIKQSGSVVLAATPLLKKEGIKTGSRLFEIPKRKDIHVVNPSIDRYIKASNYISSLVLQYVVLRIFMRIALMSCLLMQRLLYIYSLKHQKS
ncbi:hypothetical protein P4678_24430 [Priestia megaterium]|nr:hypothetical protein [Priestia megaterium]MDH3168729.1 hypothetical protein [Priestia megaterium]MED4292938.1 hypothetical protein [Priestia megaterium]MED4297778.1 hypothetical protein [Priestia megaterium]